MKLYVTTALLGVLILSSCKEFGEQEAKTNVQEESETETSQDTLPNEEMRYADSSFNSEELQKNVALEDILGTSLEEWQNREKVRLSMDDLERKSQEDIPAVTKSLKEDLQKMREDLPADDRTVMIQNQFDSVASELDDLQEVLEEEGVNEEKINTQVKEVIAAYDGLENELGIPVEEVERLK